MTATQAAAELRAGGTDLSERRRSGLSVGPVIELVPTGEMAAISWDAAGSASIGAATTIAAIARDERIAVAYPALAAAAHGLATPQIREIATLGGNLAQRTRCWYYRNPQIACLKKGGSECPARNGNHLYGVAFDLGSCVAPHPSTMATALLANDGRISTNRRRSLSITELLGDGSDGRIENLLQPGEIIERVTLSPPPAGERAAYRRAISRSRAEWPLVELVGRVVIANGSFELLRLAAGGIAPVPVRLAAAEAYGQGEPTGASTIAAIADHASSGAAPLPMTHYKLELLKGLVRDVLEGLTEER
ncbi:MAG TPA: FAD binding domain-containing protein [Stellaceae bacterium]|nr:FAD binding domain-containing protein [Stellaceae bacterium]